MLIGEQGHKINISSLTRAISQEVGRLETWTGAQRFRGQAPYHAGVHAQCLPIHAPDGVNSARDK